MSLPSAPTRGADDVVAAAAHDEEVLAAAVRVHGDDVVEEQLVEAHDTGGSGASLRHLRVEVHGERGLDVVHAVEHADQRLHVHVEAHRRFGLRADVRARNAAGRASARRTACSDTPSARPCAMGPSAVMSAWPEFTSGQNVVFASCGGAVWLGTAAAVEELTWCRQSCSASRVLGQNGRRSALKPEAMRLQQQARDRRVAAVTASPTLNAVTTPCLASSKPSGRAASMSSPKSCGDEHALVVVVAVAIVGDGDGVRVAAVLHAADDVHVREAHDRDVARGVVGDERESAVRRDGDAARLDADVHGGAEPAGVAAVRSMTLIVPSMALVTYARLVVGAQRDEARLLAHRHFGQQIARRRCHRRCARG